ncbi:FRG domain-containing protein [Chryseobacterium sp. KCF3-3]|uniref:FRG domain-containing protein n=1 Tax=Chryseobacterium sp. KCF3-3 TaxID=3231511 RepID=UPI0038B2BA23
MEKEVNSLSELITILRDDIGTYIEDVWFRGQSNFDWQLMPGIFRYSTDISETSLLTRFKQSASLLIDTSPKDDFDWLFLMQHYGVPTRLLDWSESPLTALYFAISEEIYNDDDSALWMLKPIELNKLANIKTTEKNYIPAFDDEYLENYNTQNVNSNKKLEMSPVATIATRNNSRIQAQMGVFTIHHLDKKPLDEFCTNAEIIKYKIPKESKQLLRKELDLLSVNKFSLFPELSSIGEILKKKIS